MKTMSFACPPIAALALCASASAQGAPVFEELFDTGLPSGWSIRGTDPIRWHVAQQGECGAGSGMLAYNAGEPGCGYPGQGAGTGGIATTPSIPWFGLHGRLGLEYVLDIEYPGDEASIWMRAIEDVGVAPMRVASTEELVLGIRDFEIYVDPRLVGVDVVFEFRFRADPVGNDGLGWMIDWVGVLEAEIDYPLLLRRLGQLPLWQ